MQWDCKIVGDAQLAYVLGTPICFKGKGFSHMASEVPHANDLQGIGVGMNSNQVHGSGEADFRSCSGQRTSCSEEKLLDAVCVNVDQERLNRCIQKRVENAATENRCSTLRCSAHFLN